MAGTIEAVAVESDTVVMKGMVTLSALSPLLWAWRAMVYVVEGEGYQGLDWDRLIEVARGPVAG